MKSFGIINDGSVGWMEKTAPKIGPLDALISPIAVAPCTSDVHVVCGGGTKDYSNLTLGHEAVGEVVEVGSLVKRFKPGDRVVVATTTPDWLTLNVQGKYNQHDNGPLKSFKFVSQKDGVFAELFNVNDADGNMTLLPDGVSPASAVMVVDMMNTGFYAAELADINMGDTVLVIGIGPVGLMSVAGARLQGAGRIMAVGTRPNAVAVAKEYGATDIINYKNGDIVTQVKELTRGEGVDRVIIAGGNASTLTEALYVVKAGGVVSNVSFFDSRESFNIPSVAWGMGMANKDIRGGFCPGGALRISKLLNMITYGAIDPSKIISHKFSGFESIPDAFNLMANKTPDLIKPVVIIKE